jgi:hypothetical protein
MLQEEPLALRCVGQMQSYCFNFSLNEAARLTPGGFLACRPHAQASETARDRDLVLRFARRFFLDFRMRPRVVELRMSAGSIILYTITHAGRAS